MKYSRIILRGRFRETGPMSKSLIAAARRDTFRFDLFLAHVEWLLQRKKIDTVLVECRNGFQAGSVSNAEAIRRELGRLASAGKNLVFAADTYDAVALYLASATSIRLIHPLGQVQFLGLSRSLFYVRNFLENAGVALTVFRRGAYKSAGDRFLRNEPSEEERQQITEYLGTLHAELTSAIREGYRKSAEEIEELISGRILYGSDAVEAGWADETALPNDLIDRWKEQKAKEVSWKKQRPRYGKGKKIAVLVFDGAIVDGTSRQHPLLGQSVGAESYIGYIRSLADDKKIAGVVFRVNSPGGSAIASESVARELERLAEKKPLLVSMGSVAGSGGYWITTPARRVFAERTTLTGSIGVLMIVADARRLLNRLGISETSLKTAAHADLGQPFRELTPEERDYLEQNVEAVYERFLEKAARARKSSVDEIRSVAEGRVWSGEAAVARGLADEVGGLTKAVSYMKGLLRTDRVSVEFHPRPHFSLVERVLLKNAAVSTLVAAAPLATLPAWEDYLSLLRIPLAVIPQALGQEILPYSTTQPRWLSMNTERSKIR